MSADDPSLPECGLCAECGVQLDARQLGEEGMVRHWKSCIPNANYKVERALRTRDQKAMEMGCSLATLPPLVYSNPTVSDEIRRMSEDSEELGARGLPVLRMGFARQDNCWAHPDPSSLAPQQGRSTSDRPAYERPYPGDIEHRLRTTSNRRHRHRDLVPQVPALTPAPEVEAEAEAEAEDRTRSYVQAQNQAIARAQAQAWAQAQDEARRGVLWPYAGPSQDQADDQQQQQQQPYHYRLYPSGKQPGLGYDTSMRQ
jgi:hypothetical protein